MNRFILIMGTFCALVVVLVLATRQKPAPVSAASSSADQNRPAEIAAVEEAVPVKPTRAAIMNRARHVTDEAIEPAPAEPAVSEEVMALRQNVDLLVSPQATFQQKQAVWEQLRKDGKLDQAISELERGVTNNPTVAEYPAALGRAYIQKITPDIEFRQKAMLGMKADESFENALKLDPKNWEAGFYRAAALSHWPAESKKGPEVIEQFNNVIQLQETMTPQPQFAASYVMLGEQYQKAGQQDYAEQIWQRGAALFPTNQTLQKKIAPQP